MRRLATVITAAALAGAGLVTVATSSAAATPPRIVSVSQDTHQVRALDMIELSVDLAVAPANPYDTEQVSVWADIQPDSGPVTRIAGFFAQDYRAVAQQVLPNGRPAWHVRYTPLTPGHYTYTVSARQAGSAIATSARHSFQVTPAAGNADGFVRTDPANGRYLRFDRSGRTLYPLGLNTDFPEFTADENHQADPTSGYHGILGDGTYSPAQGLTPHNIYRIYSYYRDAIDHLAAAGGTSIRVILDSWILPLELDPTYAVHGYPDGVPGFGLGTYNQANAWIVDQILQLAQRRGIYVTLVAFDAQHEWGAKTYAKPTVENLALIERRLGYQAARWGYSPNVLAWELFNEASIDPADPFYAGVISWLRNQDPNHHLVFNSYNGVDEQETHTYVCGDGETDPTSDMYWPYCPQQSDFLSWAQFSTDQDPAADRPDLLSEYGEKWYFRLPADTDPTGTRAREGLWASLMGHHSGAQYWWTYTHLAPLNLYGSVYRGISRFIDGTDLGDFDWEPASLTQLSGPGGLTYRGMVEDSRIAGAANTPADPRALLWFVRTPSSEYTDRAPADGNVVRLADQQPGRYAVEWYDTQSGGVLSTQTVTADANGGVDLHVPDGVTRDIAAKVFGPTDAVHLTVAPGSPSIEPNQTETVSVSLTNTGRTPPPSAIDLDLSAPPGWTVRPGSPVRVNGPLPPGRTLTRTWTVTAPAAVTPARYRLTARASYDSGAVRYVVEQPFDEQALPPPLDEYGPVQAPYRTTAADTNADFYQAGNDLAIVAGGSDMWTATDQYGAIYLPGGAKTETTAVVQVSYQQAVDAKAKTGLMMRNAIDQPGRGLGYVVVGVTPQNGFVMNWDSNGDGFLDAGRTAGTSAYPAWLKLTRSGDTYTGSYSLDGTTWQPVGTVTVPGAAAAQDVGVFASAHHGGTTGRSDFSDLQIDSSSGPPATSAYNNVGITDDADVSQGDLDGYRNSYSAQALAAAGLQPGTAVSAGGLDFHWPNSVGQPDDITAGGQTITLPAGTAAGSTLGFLGASTAGPSQTRITIAYTDGTAQAADLGFSDWALNGGSASPSYGNLVVAHTSYYNCGGCAQPQQEKQRYVFYAGVAVDATKIVRSVTLPAASHGAIHIFAIAAGDSPNP